MTSPFRSSGCRVLRGAAAAVFVLVLTGCGAAAGEPTATETLVATPVSTPEDPTAGPTVAAAYWTGPFPPVALGDGRTLERCDDGDAPVLCVWADGEVRGDVTLGTYPADPGTTAASHAESFLAGFVDDRGVGCPDFRVEPVHVVAADVGGSAGATTGFRLTDEAGRVVEEVVVWFAVVDDALHVVQADAYVPDGGCLPPDDIGTDLAPGELARVLAGLRDVVARTPLPPATGSA